MKTSNKFYLLLTGLLIIAFCTAFKGCPVFYVIVVSLYRAHYNAEFIGKFLGIDNQTVLRFDIAVGDSGKIVRSTDAGANWSIVSSGTNATLRKISGISGTLAPVWIVGDSGIILFSSNTGLNWVRQTSGTTRNLRSVRFADSLTGFIAGDSIILKTTNGGNNWVPPPPPPSLVKFNDISVAPGNIYDVIVVGDNLKCYVSFTGGNTWAAVLFFPNPGPRNINAVNHKDASHAWIVGDSGLVYYTDMFGSYFTAQHSNVTQKLNDILFLTSDSGIAVGNNGTVLLTSDHGSNWYNDTSTTDRTTKNLNGLARVNSNTVMGVGDSGLVSYGSTAPLMGIENENEGLPKEFALYQNYPNPFNPSTRIKFTLPSPSSVDAKGRVGSPRSADLGGAGVGSYVSLKVYDILGREVATLVNEDLKPGSYEVTWDARQTNGGQASGMASGLYLYRLTAGTFSETKKLVLLR